MSLPHSSTISSLALVSEQRSRVRDLRGFLKTHQVPSDASERSQQFVGRIAAADIGEDLDQRFADFRRHFRFRRVDLRVSDPDSGMGAIATPWFDYRVTVRVAEDDCSETVWRRQVSDFRDPEALLSSELAAAFGELFDTLEVEPPDAIEIEDFIDTLEERDRPDVTIEYDRTATWCQLTVKDVPGVLTVTSDCVSLHCTQPQLPARLLEAFLRMRDELDAIECW